MFLIRHQKKIYIYYIKIKLQVSECIYYQILYTSLTCKQWT
jgi:hypothetical protein